MNIHQGLKEKNRLAGKLKKLDEWIANCGHWVKGNAPAYNLIDLLERRKLMVDKLIKLKNEISIASQPMNRTMMILAEKKTYINLLKGLNVSRGIQTDYYRRGTEGVEYDSAMSEAEKDKLIEDVEQEISDLQDKLDAFNAITDLEGSTLNLSGSV